MPRYRGSKDSGWIADRAKKQEENLQLALSAMKEKTNIWTAKEEKAASEATVDFVALNLMDRYKDDCIRDMSTFNRTLKSKDKGKVQLVVATHLFGKYKVPAHLQECWYTDSVTKSAAAGGVRNWRGLGQRGEITAVTDTSAEILMRRNWFITAASGGSMYKVHGKSNGFTKQEMHTFLTCNVPCNFREAIIYAIAKQWTDDLGIVTRIMKTKLNTKEGITWQQERTIWREVIHFFCVNKLEFAKMNDLMDYFNHVDNHAAMRGEQYSLKGRNLQSISRQMQDWHYELQRVKRMGDAKWDGIPIADSDFILDGQKDNHWFFEQMKSSKALAAEGTAMHHCVYSYQQHCISGRSSIWSVKVLQKKKSIAQERCLTLEINEDGEIVQVRGFANRMARPVELEALRHWARKEGLTIVRDRYYGI